MKLILMTMLGAFLALCTNAQCLTDFTKLLPTPSIDNTLDFGRSIAMDDDYLAIGIPNSDSLGRLTGIVHIYKKNNNIWQKVAVLGPRIPSNALQFGSSLRMSKDYLLVGATGNGGKVYLFKKPSSGWGSDLLYKYQNEHTIFTVSKTTSFGVSQNTTIDIAEDQRTIAITDQDYIVSSTPTYRSGAIFIYRSDPLGNWSTQNYTMLTAPEDDAADFGRGGVAIFENRIATAAPFGAAGGRIYVYKDLSGEFNDLMLEAKLSSGTDPNESYMFGMSGIAFTKDGIFSSAAVNNNTRREFQIIYFKKPVSGNWTDAIRTCSIDPDGNKSIPNWLSPIQFSVAGEDIYVSSRDSTGTGFVSLLSKGATGWCDPLYESVDIQPGQTYPAVNNYGIVMTSNHQTNVAIGFVSHPDNQYSHLSLKVLSKNVSGTWDHHLMYPKAKSSAGHYYGSAVLGLGDYLFVGSTNDGTIKPRGGKVYVYHKNGTTWEESNVILPPNINPQDFAFGRALASNGKYLAIGGTNNNQPFGKVLVYKNTHSDWSKIDLVQEIKLPDTLTIYTYGDHLAMNDDWLVVPYVQNSPARNILAIFKFNGTTWDFKQIEEIAFGSLFAKESTLDVDIDHDVIVSAGVVLELGNDGLWHSQHILSPSDPEPIRIAPDFSHWVSNGSLFGYSCDITDDGNTIFIGAPTRDYEGTWDVGAVYVYKKRPGESWTSREETVKILPRIKEERELFGYSLKGLYNTLIVGAPGSDYTINGSARNKPGRAYVFQSQNYFWQDALGLIDFTGDSFVKDYFGIHVNLDETDFFIGASIEDISTGKLSGSVYVTPTPPIIKLVPPVCSSEETIDLFGYPFNGTWTGPGLLDDREGIFDPKIAGPGVHEFTYTTESCAYEGKLQIQVEEPPIPVLDVDDQISVCKNAGVDVEINVQPEEDTHYQWYYRENPGDTFTSLEIRSTSMNATRRGEYQVQAYNHSCQALSSIITILDEHVDIVAIPPAKSCEKSKIEVPLLAEPAGGIWSGLGVSGNTFIAENLHVGSYSLTYQYTSSKGCVYETSTVAEVVPSFVPLIRREGNLCTSGEVMLNVQGSPSEDIQFIWYGKNLNETSFTIVAENETSVSVNNNGTYMVVAQSELCERESVPVTVNDQLTASIPSANETEICYGEAFPFTVTPNESEGNYEWYYSENENGPYHNLYQNSAILNAERSGYYYAIVNRGVCSTETEHKRLTVHPQDSIFIPNVITPNEDSKNDVFEVRTTMEDWEISIFNRYGEYIYTVDQNNLWNGNGFPSGIYYWQATYNSCLGEKKTLKGFIHLLR